jgi:hypothetical protein
MPAADGTLFRAEVIREQSARLFSFFYRRTTGEATIVATPATVKSARRGVACAE